MRKGYDVVVAGAGIAGLSIAALLARSRNSSVLLIEKGERPGGRFAVEERDGYLLDMGVHACLLGGRGAIGRVLSLCDSAVRIVPVGAAIHDGGNLVPFLGEGLSSLAGQKAMSKRDLIRMGIEAIGLRGRSWYDTSITEWSERRGIPEDLLRVVQALCVGLAPTAEFDKASSGEIFSFLRFVMRSGRAMGYPMGGWGRVLDALAGKVETSPECDVVLGRELERVHAPGGRVRSVVVGGEEFEARAVVFAFPPGVLASPGMVEPALPAEYRERLDSLEDVSGVCVDIALRSPVTADRRLILSVEPPALLWAVSNVSPEVAPPGRQLLQLFLPLRKDEEGDVRFVGERVDELVDLASRVFRAELDEEWRRVMTTKVVSVAPFAGQARTSRPGIVVPGVSGMFLIGDGVSAAGLGGDLAARSALEAERMVSGYL